MDPAQLANEALKRFAARDLREPGNEPLLDLFAQLGQLDGWAKIAIDRLVADPQDARAEQDLGRCLEHTARLHPHFTRRLADVVADRPAVRTSISTTVPQQPLPAGRAPSEPRG